MEGWAQEQAVTDATAAAAAAAAVPSGAPLHNGSYALDGSGATFMVTLFALAGDGGSVLVVALDMRYAKTPYDGPAGDGDFLGEAQWAWLEAVVDGSTADAHVFVSSLQLLEWRRGKAENWGRFPKAKARFIDVVARAKSAVVVSGDVHMAEIAGARCGSKLLLDVTSSGISPRGRRQN